MLQVLKELEALSASYPFQVPSYFALILRAFSVIEGIALRVSI
jgi:aarF domain-containing kinase